MCNKMNCVDYLVKMFFKIDIKVFKESYGTEYPTTLDLVSFVAKHGWFIGAGSARLSKTIKITFSRDLCPLLMVVRDAGSEVDHAVIYNKGRVIDLAGRDAEYYEDKIIGIYPINKLTN